MAAMIEGQARAEAKVRQVAGQSAGRDIQHGKLDCGQLATIQKQPSISHKARDEIAEAVGMATTTLRRAQDVVKHGTPELVKAMDSGEVSITRAVRSGKVKTPHNANTRLIIIAQSMCAMFHGDLWPLHLKFTPKQGKTAPENGVLTRFPTFTHKTGRGTLRFPTSKNNCA